MVSVVQLLAGQRDDWVVDRFAPVLDCSPNGVALVEHGRVFYANPAFAALLDLAGPEEVLGKSLVSLRPELDCGSYQHEGDVAQSCAGHPVCDFDRLRPDGAAECVEVTCTPFPLAGRNLRIVNLRDVTERERRRTLHESECRLRAIFHAVAIGMVQCSSDGRIVESNPAIEHMLGYSHEELRGRLLGDFFPDGGADPFLRLFNQPGDAEAETYQAEHSYVSGTGAQGWVRTTASFVAGVSDQPPCVIVMTEEITEYKRQERQLRDAQKMEAVGRLVGGVAHDFNNLLTGIMLYCDLLTAGLKANSRLRQHADEIRMAGEQGAALIQQLLAIARQQVVEPRILCINAKIVDTRDLLSRLLGENIELDTELDASLGEVRIDPTQFQQILLNLVLNARDAMPGGGQILVRTVNCNFELPASIPGGPMPGVMLTVIDNGCGMSAETRSHLFEPFFTTKSAGRGNGLGLATVHDIVQNAGGVIEVDSEVGRGTTFHVTLPRVPEASKSEIPEFRYSPRAARETILVLEDNLTVRQAVRGILQECGYCVLEAGTGPEALALADAHEGSLDLLLADLVLPGISGRTVARRLRATRPNLKCLYMSGYEPQNHESRVDAEPVIFFKKPFTGAVLLQRVRDILEASAPAPTENESEN
jgi:two-component system cell cycle sensor histidine kinase/response regulator CckA